MSGMQKIDLSDQSGCEIPKSENPSFWEEERRRQLEAIEASRQGRKKPEPPHQSRATSADTTERAILKRISSGKTPKGAKEWMAG